MHSCRHYKTNDRKRTRTNQNHLEKQSTHAVFQSKKSFCIAFNNTRTRRTTKFIQFFLFIALPFPATPKCPVLMAQSYDAGFRRKLSIHNLQIWSILETFLTMAMDKIGLPKNNNTTKSKK